MAPIAFQKLMRCGRAEGYGYDGDMDPAEVARIIRLSIHPYTSDSCIGGLTVVYKRHDGKEKCCSWGDTGSMPTEIFLESNEYIIALSGNCDKVLRLLKVETNFRTFTTVGHATRGKPFELPAFGGQIIGFHVSYDSSTISAIGTYVKAIDGDANGCRAINGNGTAKLVLYGNKTGDEGDIDPTHVKRITRIGIHTDGSVVVVGLTVHYQLRDGTETTCQWGNTHNHPREMTFKPNEYLIAVSGYYTSDFVISIKLETNIRTFGPVGEERGTPFEHPALGGQIIGFHACYTTEYLRAIGVYVKATDGDANIARAIYGHATTATFAFHKVTRFGNETGAVGDIDLTVVQGIIRIGIHLDGSTVGGLSVRYRCYDGTEITRNWGNTCNQPRKITLKPEEYIRVVSGRYTNFVCSLKIKTNLRTFGVFGSKEGMPFEIPAFGGQIFGFHARYNYKSNLQAIGVYIKAADMADEDASGSGTTECDTIDVSVTNGDKTSGIATCSGSEASSVTTGRDATDGSALVEVVIGDDATRGIANSTAVAPFLGLQQKKEEFCLYLKQIYERRRKTFSAYDWELLDRHDPCAVVVARAQGLLAQCSSNNSQFYCSHNIVFLDDKWKGSSLEVRGMWQPQSPESPFKWTIVGGTGEFKLVDGFIYGKQLSYKDNIRISELFIHVFYWPLQSNAA